MGSLWEPYGKGVPFLGAPRNSFDPVIPCLGFMGLTGLLTWQEMTGCKTWDVLLVLDVNGGFHPYMGVSKNRGTPKWIVYNGKPY